MENTSWSLTSDLFWGFSLSVLLEIQSWFAVTRWVAITNIYIDLRTISEATQIKLKNMRCFLQVLQSVPPSWCNIQLPRFAKKNAFKTDTDTDSEKSSWDLFCDGCGVCWKKSWRILAYCPGNEHIPSQGPFEDDFLFPKVGYDGYVSSP